MPGIQSTKETCTGAVSYGASGGAWKCAESTAASRKSHCARANCCIELFGKYCYDNWMQTYDATCDVHARCAPVLPQANVEGREWIQADSSRVVVRTWNGHVERASVVAEASCRRRCAAGVAGGCGKFRTVARTT